MSRSGGTSGAGPRLNVNAGRFQQLRFEGRALLEEHFYLARIEAGPNGEQMTELAVNNGSGTWDHTDLNAGATLIGTYRNDNQGVHFRLTDWLGTLRAQTNYAGQLESTCPSAMDHTAPRHRTRSVPAKNASRIGTGLLWGSLLGSSP